MGNHNNFNTSNHFQMVGQRCLASFCGTDQQVGPTLHLTSPRITKMKINLIAFATAGLLMASVAPLRADDAADAKKIYEDKQDSVIWMTGVTKLSVSATGKAAEGRPDMPDREVKVMALGTIVSPDGYAVAALSQFAPPPQAKERTTRTKDGPVTIKTTFVGISELKAVMPDGTEIPSELVMMDENRNLAIVHIRTRSKEARGMVFHAVDLKDSAEGHTLDEVVTLSRMPEIYSRAPSIARGHITMITKAPRVFLCADGATGGCPTFNLDGKLIGIATTRTGSRGSVEPVILPAADVLAAVKQGKKYWESPEMKGKAEEK
jgi:hypothetical protein